MDLMNLAGMTQCGLLKMIEMQKKRLDKGIKLA